MQLMTRLLKRFVLPFALPLVLSACAQTGGSTAPTLATMSGTNWTAMTMSGMASIESDKSTLRFLSDKEVAGSGGCNTFSGPARMDAGKMMLGPIVSTKRACVGPVQAQESMFFKHLSEVRGARMLGDDLVLTNANGDTLLRLRKMPL
jgi:heat shock protein HslJ